MIRKLASASLSVATSFTHARLSSKCGQDAQSVHWTGSGRSLRIVNDNMQCACEGGGRSAAPYHPGELWSNQQKEGGIGRVHAFGLVYGVELCSWSNFEIGGRTQPIAVLQMDQKIRYAR